MLALDVVCEKLMEEASEVSLECATLVQAASKTFRFGTESMNQRRPEEGSNAERLYRAYAHMEEEFRDVRTLMLLFCSMVQPSPLSVRQISEYLPTRSDRSHAKKHLCKMRRYASILVEKGSLSNGELLKLQRLIDGVVELVAELDPEVH